MRFERLAISDVVLITPRKFLDERGFFMETFRHENFCKFVGKDIRFIQDNHSLSISANTVRGLHYQLPPYAQGKLVRCTRGSIVDVAVDARQNSPTYGVHVTAKLTAENGCQLWVPEGFLHGFSTLDPYTEVQYKCTNYYSAECDGNRLWNDPALGIDWGIDPSLAILSDKDKLAPKFTDFDSPFQL
jgi:dTDP-4-dehydrorhamnose 3,5-epimerase